MYTKNQQYFCLSILANGASKVKGTAQELSRQLATYIRDRLSQNEHLLGPWKVVWGPVVIADSQQTASTAAYIASKTNGAESVVAFAGTNPTSVFDWLTLDLNVREKVPWPFNQPLSGQVAKGQLQALSIVVNELLDENGRSAADFLRALMKERVPDDTNGPSYSIQIAGHSLGGAMSTTFGTFLADTRGVWDPNNACSLHIFPTAAPTVGDDLFVTYMLKKLDSNNYLTYNSLDVVPHAFQEDTFAEISDIYGPSIKPSYAINLALNGAKAVVKGKDYRQTPNAHVLSGTLSDQYKNFAAQAIFQHVDAYEMLMDVPEFWQTLGKSADVHLDAPAVQGKVLGDLVGMLGGAIAGKIGDAIASQAMAAIFGTDDPKDYFDELYDKISALVHREIVQSKIDSWNDTIHGKIEYLSGYYNQEVLDGVDKQRLFNDITDLTKINPLMSVIHGLQSENYRLCGFPVLLLAVNVQIAIFQSTALADPDFANPRATPAARALALFADDKRSVAACIWQEILSVRFEYIKLQPGPFGVGGQLRDDYTGATIWATRDVTTWLREAGQQQSLYKKKIQNELSVGLAGGSGVEALMANWWNLSFNPIP